MKPFSVMTFSLQCPFGVYPTYWLLCGLLMGYFFAWPVYIAIPIIFQAISLLTDHTALVWLVDMEIARLLKSQIKAGAKAKRQGQVLEDNPWLDDKWGEQSANIRKLAEAWSTGWKQQA